MAKKIGDEATWYASVFEITMDLHNKLIAMHYSSTIKGAVALLGFSFRYSHNCKSCIFTLLSRESDQSTLTSSL